MDSYSEIWDSVCTYCREKELISQTGFDLWLKPLYIESFKGNTFTLQVQNSFRAQMITEQFGIMLSEAFSEVVGFPCEIKLVWENEEEKQREAEVQTDDELFTFDNFVEGPSNQFAYRAAIAVSKDPGGHSRRTDGFNYNPLFIYGNSGLGKTHLLNAVACDIRKNFPDYNVISASAEEFANEFISALGQKRVDEFHFKFRSADVLLVDDIQFIAGKDTTEEEFFHTFNALVENGRQIVLTSDRPPNEIRSLTERLCTRFENGLLADIKPPEYETRCAIIKNKAVLLGFDLNDNIINYIAEKIKSNIRQLEGATNKLCALCRMNNQTPTLALAQQAIKDVINEKQPLPVTMDKIIEEVSRTEGVDAGNICGKSQASDVSHARQMAMYIIRAVTNCSFDQIGEKFNRNHATVMHSVEKIADEIQQNPKTDNKVNDIINNIKDSL